MINWDSLQKLNEKLYKAQDAASVWMAVIDAAIEYLHADDGVWVGCEPVSWAPVHASCGGKNDAHWQALLAPHINKLTPVAIPTVESPTIIMVPVNGIDCHGWLMLERKGDSFREPALDAAVFLSGLGKNKVSELVRYQQLEATHQQKLTASPSLLSSSGKRLLTESSEHELQQQLSALASLQNVTRELTATLELDYILKIVLEEVLRFSHASAGFIVTFEPEGQAALRAVQGYSENDLDNLQAQIAKATHASILSFLVNQNSIYIGDITRLSLQPAIGQETPVILVSPVFYAERLAASIVVQAVSPGVFNTAVVEYVESIGIQTSIAIGNAQRYHEQVQRGEVMHQRAEQMARLLEVSRTMRSDRPLEDILLDVAYAVQEGSGFDVVLISVLEGDHLRRVAGAGIPLVELEKRKKVQVPWTRVAKMCQDRFRIGQCFYVPEGNKTLTEGLDLYVAGNVKSGAQPGDWHPEDIFFVPLRGGNEDIVGILSVDAPRDAKAPSPATAEVIEIFASQVALAIENNRLIDSLRKQVTTLQLFNELSRSIATKLDLPLVLNTVVQAVTNLLDYDYATIFLKSQPDQPFVPLASSGYTLDLLDNPSLTAQTSILDKVISRGMPLVIEDTNRDARYIAGPVKISSSIVMPLMVEGRPVGVLTADRKVKSEFSPAEVATLTALADQVAVAVENARLFEEVKRFNDELETRVAARTRELAVALEGLRLQRDRSEVLYHIASELVASLDIDRVLSQTLSLLQRAVKATRSSVILLDNNTGQLYYRAAIGHTTPIPPGGKLAPFTRDSGIVGWVLHNRQAAVIPDAHLDARCDFDPELNIASVLAVPILGGERESLGVILLQSSLVNMFDDPQLRLVEAAAVQIGNALNNAELYRLIREQAARLGTLLREQQIEAAKNQAILEGIADGVMVADAEGKITLFNRAAERILSIARNQALGRFQDDILGLYGREAREWLERIERWKQYPEESVSDSYLAQSLEVGRRFVSVHLSPVISSAKEFLGVVAVFRDITAEIEADRAKSDFVSTVSHELRTPMTSIVGYVDLIIKGVVGSVTEMQLSFLNKIKVNADRLTDLVNDLLDISRIEEGRVELQMEPVAMDELIQQVTEMVTPKIVEKDQSLETVIPVNMPRVYGDPGRLRQILTNLLGNAYKYTPTGGKITVYAYVRESMMHIAVADTGIGIAPENQKRIFERFYRVEDDPAVYEVSGTGLGLAITLSLIQMHGGSISLDSELGEGSTFTFSIPLAEGEVKDDVGDSPPELYTSSTATVLIIEDDIEILKMLQVTLEAEGLKTFTATSGEDGLRIAREKLPDLISLDIRLPDLDGYEVLQLLKRTPDTADIPVFILSVVDNRKRGLSLGAMDYLVKPFSEDKLMRVVRRALRSKGTIIVAHRDREILLHIRSALQSQGLAVRTTMRGDRALRLTRELMPEVVAFDLALPDIDGVQFIETLKSNQRTANIPIIVMFEDENRRMGLNSLEMDGTVRFVRSPFAVQKLAEDISNLISNDGLSKE